MPRAPFAIANVMLVVARRISATTTVLPAGGKKGRSSGVKITSIAVGMVGLRIEQTNLEKV